MTLKLPARLLPEVADVAAYEALWPNDAQFQEAVRSIAKRHTLSEPPERYRTGTAVAYRLGEAVLKLYPPVYAADAALEREVLLRAQADAHLPTPRVLAHGDQDGWSYLLMTRLVGRPLEELAAAPAFYDLMGELGAALRRLHALPSGALPRVDAAWEPFRATCRSRAVEHHVARGFAALRTRELEQVLGELDREVEDEGAHVLLHTELGPGHVLTDAEQLTGIFDFGEAREGPRSFDFAAVGLFISHGERRAFRAFLDGYGVAEHERGDRLIRNVMRHALLHPYGHLTFYFDRSPPPNPNDLWSAAVHWFGH